MLSRSEALGFRPSTQEFWGNTVQSITPSWNSEWEAESEFHSRNWRCPALSFPTLPCSWAGHGTHTLLMEACALDRGSGGSKAGTRAEGLSLPLLLWATCQEQPDPLSGTEEGVWLAGEAISASLCSWCSIQCPAMSGAQFSHRGSSFHSMVLGTVPGCLASNSGSFALPVILWAVWYAF